MNFEKSILTEEQKDYEKRAAKRAAAEKTRAGRFITSVTGQGFNGEDVVRIDAKLENSYRDQANNETDPFKRGVAMDKADRAANSDLSVSIDEKILDETMVMSGKINGRDALITKKIDYDMVSFKPWDRVEKGQSFSGQIDGVEISPEEAETIWNDYAEIAAIRDFVITRSKKEGRKN